MIKRADKAKNVDKVAAELVKNPLASEREIAKATGVGKSSVNRAKEQVGRGGASGKDKRIIALTELDYELTYKCMAEQLRRIDRDPEKINNGDIIRMAEASAKRYSLFRGEATDDRGGLKVSVIDFSNAVC